MEVLTKTSKVGFLLQPTVVRTQGTNDPVGVGTTTDQWSNVQDASATYFSILAEAGSVVPNANVSSSSLNATGSTTMFAEKERTYINNNSVLPTVDMSIYCTPTVLTALLLGALQSATENTSTPFSKFFTPADTVLDYHNNEGYLFSIAGMGYNDGVSAGDGFILQNAVVNSLRISVSNALGDTEPRLMKADVQFIGTKLLEGQYIPNFTTPETYIFNQSGNTKDAFVLPNISFGGAGDISNVFYKNFELNISNNYFSDSVASDGTPNNLKRANPEITCSVDVPYNESTYQTLSKYKDGTLLDSIRFYNGYSVASPPEVNDFYLIKGNFMVLTENPRKVDGEYFGLNLTSKFLKSGGSWNLTFRVSDGVDWSEL